MNDLKARINQLKPTLAGRFLYRFLPYRRAVIAANMDQVFGEQLTGEEKIHLAKAYYSHLAASIREALQLRFLSEKKLRECVEVRGEEHMLNTVAKKRESWF